MYQDDAIGISFLRPNGWEAAGIANADLAIVARNLAPFRTNLEDYDFPEEDFVAIMVEPTKYTQIDDVIKPFDDEGSYLTSVTEEFLGQSYSIRNISEPEILTVNGQEAVHVRLNGIGNSRRPFDLTVTIILSSGRLAFVAGVSWSESSGDSTTIIELIVKSILIHPPSTPHLDNNEIDKAQGIDVGKTYHSPLRRNEIHYARLISDNDHALQVSVIPEGALDVVLQLYQSDGRLVNEVDASSGPEALTIASTTGRLYIVGIKGYFGSTGSYTVAVRELPLGLSLGDVHSDHVEARQSHTYLLTGYSGEQLSVIVEPEPGLDVILENSDTYPATAIDRAYGTEQYDYSPTSTGPFYMTVRNLTDINGSYTIRVGKVRLSEPGSTVTRQGHFVENGATTGVSFLASSTDSVTFELVLEEPLNVLLQVVEVETGEAHSLIATSDDPIEADFLPEKDGIYRLHLSTNSTSPMPFELWSRGSEAVTFDVSINDIINGWLDGDSTLTYRYMGVAGEPLLVTVDPDRVLDIALEIVYGGVPETFLEVVDNERIGDVEVATLTLPSTGEYLIRVNNVNQVVGTFSLDISPGN